MVGRRVGADVEAFSDRPIAQPRGQQPQHFDLPVRQTVRTPWQNPCQQRIHQSENPGLADRRPDAASLVGQAPGLLVMTVRRRK